MIRCSRNSDGRGYASHIYSTKSDPAFKYLVIQKYEHLFSLGLKITSMIEEAEPNKALSDFRIEVIRLRATTELTLLEIANKVKRPKATVFRECKQYKDKPEEFVQRVIQDAKPQRVFTGEAVV